MPRPPPHLMRESPPSAYLEYEMLQLLLPRTSQLQQARKLVPEMNVGPVPLPPLLLVLVLLALLPLEMLLL